MMGEPIPFRKPKPEPLRNPGVGRDAENEKSLCFYFSRRVTDYEMRFLHDVMQRASACMPEEPAHD
jgi:hypothetical protein